MRRKSICCSIERVDAKDRFCLLLFQVTVPAVWALVIKEVWSSVHVTRSSCYNLYMCLNYEISLRFPHNWPLFSEVCLETERTRCRLLYEDHGQFCEAWVELKDMKATRQTLREGCTSTSWKYFRAKTPRPVRQISDLLTATQESSTASLADCSGRRQNPLRTMILPGETSKKIYSGSLLLSPLVVHQFLCLGAQRSSPFESARNILIVDVSSN